MTPILFPRPPEPIADATVVRWLKQPGESFAAGEPLVELEADNVQIVVESVESGKITKILVEAGRTVSVGNELARFESDASLPRVATASPTTEELAMQERPADGGGKVIPILMPQAGNTMEEGTVLAWRVKEGERIAVGQVLCEIETDKATMDFESPNAGRLARLVAREGDTVAVKEVIALLADEDADAVAYLAGRGQPAGAAPTATTAPPSVSNKERPTVSAAVTSEGRVKASPAARKIATQRGVALASVGAGSGPGGRILSSDLEDFEPTTVAAANGSEVRRPLSKMRRAIGLNLQQSKQMVPHFYVRMTIDAGLLLAYYREQDSAANCTLNDLVVLAVGRAVREFPAVRSQIVGNEIVEYLHANIGIAVAVDEGLVVPVVIAVDTMSLAELAAESKRVVELARNGRLENVGKGHFTISNLGMFGVEEFSAIINPPESGILAVSAAREAVIVENGVIRAGRSMTMTLSADHRIIDGVMAAKFMARLKEILEHPDNELR